MHISLCYPGLLLILRSALPVPTWHPPRAFPRACQVASATCPCVASATCLHHMPARWHPPRAPAWLRHVPLHVPATCKCYVDFTRIVTPPRGTTCGASVPGPVCPEPCARGVPFAPPVLSLGESSPSESRATRGNISLYACNDSAPHYPCDLCHRCARGGKGPPQGGPLRAGGVWPFGSTRGPVLLCL